MADLDAALRELADAYGVATEFRDWQGRTGRYPRRRSSRCLTRWA
jgi:hypothetical protein